MADEAMAKQMTDDARKSYVVDLTWGLRAKLPYGHPEHYRVGGGALREVQQREERARKALEKAGVLGASIEEAKTIIRRQTAESCRREIASSEKSVADAELRLAQARERLDQARARQAKYLAVDE